MAPGFSCVSRSGQVLSPEEADFDPAPLVEALSGAGRDTIGPASQGQEAVSSDPALRQAGEEELARAREEAAQLLAQARQQALEEAQRIRQQVESQVRAEEQEAFRRAAEELLAEMRSEGERVKSQVAEQVAALAIEIAERLVRSSLEARPEAVVEMARAALSTLGDDGQVRLVVSPQDQELLTRHKADLLAVLPPGAELSVIAEEGMGRGDVVVQGKGGEIDARIDTQLSSFAEELERAHRTENMTERKKAA